MKRIAIIAVWLIAARLGFCVDPLKEAWKTGHADMGEIKIKAAAGDAAAQLSMADTLSSNFKYLQALEWYRKAASQGVVEANRRTGEMLLFGEPGIPASETVKANPPEGIAFTFAAATNLDAKACLNMATAFQSGIGVSTNLVEAYAWLALYAEKDTIMGKAKLNQLALKLDVPSIRAGLKLADEFKAHRWHAPPATKIPEAESGLRLGGVSIGGKISLAIINGRSVAEGESVVIPVKERRLTVKCLLVKDRLAQVQVDGESEPRWLVQQ